jgi:hypothetical protein
MKPSGDRTVVGFRYGSMMKDALLAISVAVALNLSDV